MIEIKNIQGNVIYSTEINKGAKRKFQLMKEDYITLPFSLETPTTFGVGCNVEVNGELFEITDSQKPTYNNATGGYDYQLRLDAYYWKWKNKIFKFTPEVGGQEASWSLTASLDVHLNVFLANLKALGYTYRGTEFEFSIDATVENKAMSMTYENTNMIDALSAMAESWQCEWWITDNIINFGRCEFGTPIDFEIHKNVVEMTSSASQSPYATRLYVFGSTNNIPTNYRHVEESLLVNGVVQKRLMLPEGIPYLDAYEGMKQEEAIEEVVIIEDIYPKTDGKIDSVVTYEDSVENEDGTTTTETFYRFTDDGINFSKDYIIEGEELKVKFTSGSLNGMEFGVVFNPNEKPEKLEDGTWNTEAQLYEVVINEDYGRKLPDSVLHPKKGDTYVLIGWDSTKIADLGLISKAEDELLSEGRKILEKRKIDPNTYNCKMFSDYMFGLNEEGEQDSAFLKTFEIGDKVKLINPAYFDSGRESRIIGYEYNLDFPYDNPIYTVGETFSYSRLGELESRLESLTFKGYTYSKSSSGSGGGVGVYIIGTNDTTKPTNKNVFSAARTEKSFLSKQKDDRTPYGLSVGRDLVSEKELRTLEAVWSFLTGKGTLIKDGLIQTDRLEVRQSMTVMDLIINQLQGIAADFLFSDVGKVDSVTEIADRTYVLHIEKKTDFDFTTLGDGDILQMVVNDLYKGGGNYFSSWMRVLSVDTDANEVTVVLYDDDQVQGGRNFAPVAGYNVARRGNVNVPDEGETNERANYWMLSSREGRIQFLQNMFKPMLEDYNYALTLGKLPDIKAIRHLPVTPNKDVGLVAQTAIVENLYEFDYNGDLVPKIVDRGNWSLEVAQGDSPYRFHTSEELYPDESTYTLLEQHSVWHNGVRFRCLKDKTTEEPKWNSTDWAMMDEYELEMRFTSSEGNAFHAGKVDTEITPSVYLGNIDISDDIAVIDWIWTYELGEYNGRVLHLTNELMPPNWSRTNKAKFTCTAYVRRNEEDVTPVSNYVSV